MSQESATIVVLGSFMTDIISYVKSFPKPGETLTGDKLVICCGGKGANQGVTAARLGATTAIIGKLGDDSFGHTYLESLKREGIHTNCVGLTKEALTGVGQILVEETGQNCVVVVSGSNDHVTPEDVAASKEIISKAKIMLAEIMLPRQTIVAGLKLANELGVFTVLNAAPAAADWEPDFYALSDIFCVNETEAETVVGFPVNTSEQAVAAAHRLMEKGCKKHVLITLGSQGALLLSRDRLSEPLFVPAPKVQAVDTTGAGDCFLGALAYFLAHHPDWPIEKAVERSCSIASISVQKPGTQTSYPYRKDLDAELFH